MLPRIREWNKEENKMKKAETKGRKNISHHREKVK
jgi:hypothetical protein